jgi:pimeloyl-ACP methyl ester carboxylesterase
MTTAPNITRINGLDVAIEGDGPHTLVMVHGWPDTLEVWAEQAAFFKSHMKCVRITLPGFDLRTPRLGYSLAEVVEAIKGVIEQTNNGQPVYLMVHDWGCFFGYQLTMQHPNLVAKLVGVDIGDAASGHYVRSLSTKAKLMVMVYQLWLVLAWRLGGRIGNWMTQKMAALIKAPAPPQAIGAGQNYPYDMQWTGSFGGFKSLLAFKPSCPFLFVYGTRKPFLFHSSRWAEELNQQAGNAAIAFKTGHWVMKDAPQQFNETVLAWLVSTTSTQGKA